MSSPTGSMVYYATWKKWLTVILCTLSLLYAAPNLAPKSFEALSDKYSGLLLPVHPINLGLDLQGGSYLLLGVDMKAALNDRMSSLVDATRKELQERRIGYTSLQAADAGVSFSLREATDAGQMGDVRRKLDSGLVSETGPNGEIRFVMSETALTQYHQQILDQSVEIVRRRIDESGTKEPLIQRSGEDRILLQLPGVDNPEQIKRLIGQTAKMTFHLVDEDATHSGGMTAPPGFVSLPDRDDPNRHYVIRRQPSLSGETLTDAQAGVDQFGKAAVHFRFDALGTRRFAEITRENVNQMFAVVLDGKVITAPVINEPITGGQGQITGNFTIEGANEMAVLLRAGALPAPLTVLEERTVGPGLGQDAVHAGAISGLAGLTLVLVFMAVTYGRFGIYADIALLFNIAMIFAVLSMLGATLTLPGIAGIVLTIGIAVDANVLIYERIREELRMGRSPLSAVDAGYGRAMASITDSNLTTIIAGVVLFMLGAGPVRGFAVALTLGTVTSMFCAIMVSRLMVLRYLKAKRPISLTI